MGLCEYRLAIDVTGRKDEQVHRIWQGRECTYTGFAHTDSCSTLRIEYLNAEKMPWKSSQENEEQLGERCTERNAPVEAQLVLWNAPECSNLHMAALRGGENHGWMAKEPDRSAVFYHYREYRPWGGLWKQYWLPFHLLEQP
jgi:hypothetical protein